MVTVNKYHSYNRNAAASAAGLGQINHSNAASGAFRVALVNASYTFSNNHSVWSQITNEISAANYTSGGLVLTNVTYTVASSGTATFDADDVVVTASGTDMSAAGAVVRVGEGGALMFFIDFEATETAGDGTTFNINWASDGITQIK